VKISGDEPAGNNENKFWSFLCISISVDKHGMASKLRTGIKDRNVKGPVVPPHP